MTNKEWFKSAKFGMMIHWGIYSLPAGEWKGRRMREVSEWAQLYFKIKKEEYAKLASIFDPICFDADEWVKLAKEAGMNYLVFTSKHHDGFAMFKSKVSKFNIVDATPFGRDVTAELAEACYKHGLKFGLYYSQDLDWNHPDGGGFKEKRVWGYDEACYWTNEWDYPDNSKKDYSRCFNEKIKPQVEEILTNYGDISILWFDVPYTISPAQTDELYNLVKKLQPDCLVNSRIGNGYGDYESAEDNFIPDENMGDKLYETPATTNGSWGYKSFDTNWRTADQIMNIKKHLNERGINYLLNVGPDYLGRIPAPACDILKEVGKRSK